MNVQASATNLDKLIDHTRRPRIRRPRSLPDGHRVDPDDGGGEELAERELGG